MAENSGPEAYAPLDRRPAEKQSEVERIAYLHRQRSELDSTDDLAFENLNEVVRRVASASTDEIDRVSRTLENVRDMIRKEGDRVSREIAGYASLGRSTTMAMKVITDSLKQWKDAPGQSGTRPGS